MTKTQVIKALQTAKKKLSMVEDVKDFDIGIKMLKSAKTPKELAKACQHFDYLDTMVRDSWSQKVDDYFQSNM